jgi:RNA polymerase sigma factor (TIGR02999 family)
VPPDTAEAHALLEVRSALEPALCTLIPALHADLRRLASAQRRRQPGAETLNTTALVNELYLKLARSEAGISNVRDQPHFFALAALAMRQILIDYARRKSLAERFEHPLDDMSFDLDQMLAIDQALARMEQLDPRLVRVVECLYFAGYTESETASVLGVSERTVRRDFSKARALMQVALAG